FVLVPPPNNDSMFNIDIDIELYDVSNGPAVPTGIIATFHPEYYGGASNGKWMNASASGGKTPVSRRSLLDSPVLVRLFTPQSGGPWAIGARMLFFSNLGSPLRCHYNYFIQGAWLVA
ncbi:MAG: hypothetical protein Q8Q14_01510, partial [Gemmatimonadales bacterium]|nr:hypothetical protein [Gemmatimonadales bacterium]